MTLFMGSCKRLDESYSYAIAKPQIPAADNLAARWFSCRCTSWGALQARTGNVGKAATYTRKLFREFFITLSMIDLERRRESFTKQADVMSKSATRSSPKSATRQTPASESPKPWTFLTNHAHVLIVLHAEPGLVLREVATRVGITERAVQRIVQDLEEEGFIRREKIGRRNQYEVLADRPLRHPIESHRKIGEVLKLITG